MSSAQLSQILTQFLNMFNLLKAENTKVALGNASQTEKQQNPTRGQHPLLDEKEILC